MRDRLFVGAPPRIASYHGRGDLRAWVRMTTVRYLVDVVRAESARPDRPAGDDVLADAATTSDDPELAFLKRHYRDEFRTAFRTAMAALEPRDRNILRHRYLDDLEVAELATIYGIHRVSMSRTLARIRDDLLAGIRRDLLRRLGVGASELDSIMTLIASQLELSLSALLRR
jgi:RNA polymerase sigma-70 factor (ECF subfamily)